MKLTTLLIGFLISTFAYSQENKIVKYFDSVWTPVAKDSAFFYTEFIKEDSLYNCFSYWMKSNQLNCRSFYQDTMFKIGPIGKLVRYYKNGSIEDSSYFYPPNGKSKEVFHYYPNGKLFTHYTYNNSTQKEFTEGYDEKGKVIKNFIYLREAEFPQGNSAWQQYLTSSLRKFDAGKNGAPEGLYKVIIKFIINEKGEIGAIEPETSFGYGIEDRCIDVIKNSPKWIPMIYLGKPNKAFRRQPFTFLVSKD